MVTEVRSAAGIEGFIILGAIYLVLNLLSRAGKKAAPRETAPPTDPTGDTPSTQEEGVSLETILREIQRGKQQQEAPRVPPAQRQRQLPVKKAPPPQRRAQPSGDEDRGPLGRHSRTRLPSAEEVEERSTLEDGRSLEVDEQLEVIDDRPARRQRTTVDRDDSADEVAQRRIRDAEARNRPLSAADHRQFDARIRPPAAAAAEPKKAAGRSRLKEALVWREILGPPKSLQE